MARCRCTGGTCDCQLIAGANVIVDGDGSETTPYVISASSSAEGSILFTDTPEVTFAMIGEGTPDIPYSVSAMLPWVDPSAGIPGEVLAKQADGSWAPAPPSTVPAGSIFIGPGITGDGSSGNPLRICLTSYDALKAAVNC